MLLFLFSDFINCYPWGKKWNKCTDRIVPGVLLSAFPQRGVYRCIAIGSFMSQSVYSDEKSLSTCMVWKRVVLIDGLDTIPRDTCVPLMGIKPKYANPLVSYCSNWAFGVHIFFKHILCIFTHLFGPDVNLLQI